MMLIKDLKSGALFIVGSGPTSQDYIYLNVNKNYFVAINDTNYYYARNEYANIKIKLMRVK